MIPLLGAAVLLTLLLGWTVGFDANTEVTLGDDDSHSMTLDWIHVGHHATTHSVKPTNPTRFRVTALAAVACLCALAAAQGAGIRRRPSADDGPIERIAASPAGSRAPPLLLV